MKRQDLCIAFTFKSIVSLLFIYIYTYVFGRGVFVSDTAQYLFEAKQLNAVFYQSKSDFFTLLFKDSSSKLLVDKYLHMTDSWTLEGSESTIDSRVFVKINAVLLFFTRNSFNQFLFFNLISLFGIVQIFHFFKSYVKSKLEKVFFYGILLLPSALFWMSSVSKDSLMVFFLGLLFYALNSTHKKNYFKIFIGFVALLCLFNFRSYFVLTLILPFLFYGLSSYVLKNKQVWVSLVLILTLGLITFIFFPKITQMVTRKISTKQYDYNNVSRGGVYFLDGKTICRVSLRDSQFYKLDIKGIRFKQKIKVLRLRPDKTGIDTSFIEDKNLKVIKFIFTPTSSSFKQTLIYNQPKRLFFTIPEAFMNGLFRPFIRDLNRGLPYLNFIEMFLVFGFLVVALFLKKHKLSREENKMIIALVLFIIPMSLLIGWTTPVVGTLVRLRILVYLAIVIIGFILIDTSKWKTKEIIS